MKQHPWLLVFLFLFQTSSLEAKSPKAKALRSRARPLKKIPKAAPVVVTPANLEPPKPRQDHSKSVSLKKNSSGKITELFVKPKTPFAALQQALWEKEEEKTKESGWISGFFHRLGRIFQPVVSRGRTYQSLDHLEQFACEDLLFDEGEVVEARPEKDAPQKRLQSAQPTSRRKNEFLNLVKKIESKYLKSFSLKETEKSTSPLELKQLSKVLQEATQSFLCPFFDPYRTLYSAPIYQEGKQGPFRRPKNFFQEAQTFKKSLTLRVGNALPEAKPEDKTLLVFKRGLQTKAKLRSASLTFFHKNAKAQVLASCLEDLLHGTLQPKNLRNLRKENKKQPPKFTRSQKFNWKEAALKRGISIKDDVDLSLELCFHELSKPLLDRLRSVLESKENFSLRKLDLWGEISSKDLLNFLRHLPKSVKDTWTELRCSTHEWQPEDKIAFGRWAKETRLQSLGFSPKGWSQTDLSQMMKTYGGKLDFSCQNLDDSFLEILTQSIKDPRGGAPRSLKLQGNHFTKEAMASFENFLKHHRRPITLEKDEKLRSAAFRSPRPNDHRRRNPAGALSAPEISRQ